MKRYLLILFMLLAVTGLNAQQWFNLNLSHHWDGEAFNSGDVLAMVMVGAGLTWAGLAVEFN